MANSALHSVMLQHGRTDEMDEEINVVRWVKIFTWEGNGDGINPYKEAFKYLCMVCCFNKVEARFYHLFDDWRFERLFRTLL